MSSQEQPASESFSSSLLAYIRKLYRKFHGTRWFRVTYLILLGLIVAQLYLLTASAAACIVILLMPVSVFVVPYWLGERKMRNFAVNAAPVFVILILVAAAMSAQSLLSQNEAVPLRNIPGLFSNPNMALANGTVTPYHADPSTTFTFKVKLTTTKAAAPTDFKVYLNLTVVRGINEFERPSFQLMPVSGSGSSNNTKNGTWFQLQKSDLTGSVYGYAFSVWDKDKNWTLTAPDFGPLTASGWTFYGFFLYATALSGVTVLAVAFYFVILFMWWYTARARQARARTLGSTVDLPKDAKDVKEVRDVKAKPALEPSGKAAKVAAFTCTNCGADVTEADEKCPKCGAVFED